MNKEYRDHVLGTTLARLLERVVGEQVTPADVSRLAFGMRLVFEAPEWARHLFNEYDAPFQNDAIDGSGASFRQLVEEFPAEEIPT